MGQVIAFDRVAHRVTANSVAGDTAPNLVMVTIPISPEAIAHIDHDALWNGIGRTEFLRRFVAAGFSK